MAYLGSPSHLRFTSCPHTLEGGAEFIDLHRSDAQGFADLPHYFQSWLGASRLDEINRAGGDAGFAGQIALAQELPTPKCS